MSSIPNYIVFLGRLFLIRYVKAPYVYGLRSICLWSMVCGLWSVVLGLWSMVYVLRSMF